MDGQRGPNPRHEKCPLQGIFRQPKVRSLSLELQRFVAQEYQFGSEAETNDMWLELDFSDPVFERAVVEYVKSILALHYSPFARVRVDEHCFPS